MIWPRLARVTMECVHKYEHMQ